MKSRQVASPALGDAAPVNHPTISELAPRSNSRTFTLGEVLPVDFQPGDMDIVCGRGKGSYNRPGNRLMLEIVSQYIERYQAAQTKSLKGQVLQTIMQSILSRGIIFVKRKSQKWVSLNQKETRVKIGHAIREAAAQKEAPNTKPQQPGNFDDKHRRLFSRQQAIFGTLIEQEKLGESDQALPEDDPKHSSLLSTQQALFRRMRNESGQIADPEQKVDSPSLRRWPSVVSEGSGK